MDANKIAAAAAAAREQAKQERMAATAALIIAVLKGCDEFPLRTKNKTNELVENVFENALAIPGDDHHQQHGEQQADDDVIDERNKRRRLKLITTLEREKEHSSRKGYTIEESEDRFWALVETFLLRLKDDVHEMLIDNPESDNYRGLDSKRDTEVEVEAILLLFPDVLTRRNQLGHNNYVPIQLFALNLKAVSFIPLVARLSIELGLFEEQYRGGLFILDAEGNPYPFNVLVSLTSNQSLLLMNADNYNQDYHQDQYLQVLIKLRRMDLLKKEDIQNYGFLKDLCSRPFFAEKRFRFLVEWDPNVLLHPTEDGYLPIHYAADGSSIRGFQLLFEAGIQYFPKKKGIQLLFRKHIFSLGSFVSLGYNFSLGDTPFQLACKKFGQEQVMKVVVEDTLGFYSGDTPINITEALVTAAIDRNIHLDCVYFLLRREPDVLQKLLLSSTAMATVVDKNNNILGYKNNDNNDDSGNNGNLGGQTKTNTQKKRKRN